MHFSATTWCCESCLGQLPIRPANPSGERWPGAESWERGVPRCAAAWPRQPHTHGLSKGTRPALLLKKELQYFWFSF